MRRRRDEFVDHRIAPAPAVVLVTHLFAETVFEPVGRPRLALGNVVSDAAFQREKATAVSLRTRKHAEFFAPVEVGAVKAFAQQFGFGQFEVVAHPADFCGEFGGFGGAVIVVRNVAQAAHLEHHEGQVGEDVVPAPLFELFEDIGGPVASFELHRVGEHRADVRAQRPGFRLDRVGHVVQVFVHGLLVHVVEDRSCGAGCAVDHAREGIDLHQCVEYVFSVGNIYRDYLVAELVGQVDHPFEAVHRVGYQLEGQQFERAAREGHRDARIDRAEDREARDFERGRAFELLRVDQYHLRSLVPFEEFAAERPARTDDQVAGHVEFLGLVESHGEHVDPLLAQPRQRLRPEVVGSARELDGVDLHAADTGILEQVQLAAQLVGVHLVAVPPPPHEGAVLGIGIAELLVVSVAVCAARIAFGRCSRSRL